MDQKITLKEAIIKRKCTRGFDMAGLTKEELAEITDYAEKLPSLVSGVRVKAEIIGPDDVKSIMKWRAPHYLAIYADDSNAGLLSVGYIYEQVVLYLTTLGIGTCWATSISPKEKHEDDGTRWAAVIAFGRPDNGNAFREAGLAKRKSASEVYDRIICSFVSDIYMLAEALLKQDDITLIRRKDYIQTPKPNGYRSLHLIVEIPIFLHDRKRLMKVEVQLRTIAMDWWAS